MGRFSIAAGASRSSSGGAGGTTLPDLRLQVRGLEGLAGSTGARDISQDSPGIFRRVIDLLSRFEFAEAGFAEEFFGGQGAGAAFSRAGREFFSGVGGLKGEKRGFSEVMENLGVGELGSIGDIVPGLDNTFFDFTGRGTLGLMLGIAGDPLTWILPAGAGARAVGAKLTRLGPRGRFVSVGGKPVSKQGERFLRKEVERNLPGGKLTGASDEVAQEVRLAAREQAEAAVEKRVDDVLSGAGVSITKRAGAAAALRNRTKSIFLNDKELEPARRMLGIQRARKTKHAKLRVKSMDDIFNTAVDSELKALTRAGLEGNVEILGRAKMAAARAAERRLLAVAKENPGLLLPHGGKGAKLFSIPLPFTGAAMVIASKYSAKATAAIAKAAAEHPGSIGAHVFDAGAHVKHAFDALGGLFARDFKTRGIAGFNVMKQAHLDAQGAMTARVHREIGESAIAKLPKDEKVWKRVVGAIETGKIGSLRGAERAAADDMVRMAEQWILEEVRIGTIAADSVRRNYVAHFYWNNAEDMQKVVSAWGKGKPGLKATSGRHAEERAYQTLLQAETVSKNLNKGNKAVPILRPVYDPVEIMRRRGEAYADALSFDSWYETVAREFGGEIPFTKAQALELSRPALQVVDDATRLEMKGITEAVARGGTKVSFIKSLSPAGRKEFMRQRFLNVGSHLENGHTMRKYAEFADDFPVGGSLRGELAPDGSRYVAMPIGKKMVEVPKSVADDLQEMTGRVLESKEVGEFLGKFDTLNNFFKRMVTIYFPAFHFRNAYSNVAQMFLDIGVHALNPVTHGKTIRAMARSKGKHVVPDSELLGVTRVGERVTYGEFRKEIEELGVKTSSRALSEQTGKGAAANLRLGVVQKTARGAGLAIENEARVALYMRHRMTGLHADEAAARTKKFLFDYENLSVAEKTFFKRAVPFWVWTSKNIKLQLNQLATNPGRVANVTRPFRGRSEENDMMVSWEGEALKLRLDRDGKNVRMITGIDLPIKGLDIIWRGGLSETVRQNLGMITPLAKTPIEMATGRNLFTGRGLTRMESASIGKIVGTMPRPIKDWMGWKRDVDAAGRPRYSFDGERFYLLFQSYAVSRLVSTSDRQWREYLNDDQWGPAILDAMTGVRMKNINFTEQERRRLFERRQELREALVRRGVLRTSTIQYKPKQLGVIR